MLPLHGFPSRSARAILSSSGAVQWKSCVAELVSTEFGNSKFGVQRVRSVDYGDDEEGVSVHQFTGTDRIDGK